MWFIRKPDGTASGTRYWLFNTDETEPEGKGAYADMLRQNVIAAWGYCKGVGARATLDRPQEGEMVFFYLSGVGIIASGRVTGSSFEATAVFGQRGEFHRKVRGIKRKLAQPLTFAKIREATGYHLPARGCIVCQMHDADGAQYIARYFDVRKSLKRNKPHHCK